MVRRPNSSPLDRRRSSVRFPKRTGKERKGSSPLDRRRSSVRLPKRTGKEQKGRLTSRWNKLNCDGSL
ncbi:hypothetical protein NDU88_003391 [Pleurodeles waltl]|uniref:Uncharacterized protein n=1 Tax=Pleurodeles waltl TaxID=8319 RepID=A0AAV7W5G0_PLEWA|nr:hypothetical protein NDU88_003391 [Pleurodeles waltl]